MKCIIMKIFILSLILAFTLLFSACKAENEELNAGNSPVGTLADNAPDNVPGTLPDEAADTSQTNETTMQPVELMEDALEYSEIRIKSLELNKGSLNVMMTSMPGTTTTTASTATPTTTAPTRPGTTAARLSVTSVKLNESKKSMITGEKIILSAAIQPANAGDKTVSWVSSNPDIVFVNNNGEVIALKKGKSTITCIANGGINMRASCEVTVKSGALVSYLYDKRGYFYVEDDPWQRNFGFNRLYDFGAAYAIMYYNTVRVKFKYNELDWMIQMWKGQYGYTFIGSEIGVYTKPQSRVLEHYDCASDDNSLKMEMSIYRNDKRLFTRDYATYWWITGFVPGTIMDSKGSYDDRSGLVLTARITLKSTDMTNAFVTALKGCGFKNEGYEGASTPDRFTVTGNDVYFCWRYLAQAPVVIAFDPANGTPKINKTMECGTTLIPPEVARTGYTFTGWSPEVPSVVPAKGTTYTARWAINSYTISFDANGGTGSVAPVTQAYNTSLTLPGSGFALDGYTFAGWSTAPNAAEPLVSYWIPSWNETLYAVYKINEEPSTQATSIEVVSD